VSEGRLEAEPSPFSLHFDHREIGEPLGCIVENRHIRIALNAVAQANPRIRLFPGRSVSGIAIGDKAVEAHLSDGTTIPAVLAVSAEGRDSALREAEGIKTIGWDYAQAGIVTTVEHERPHNGVASEHFMPLGPFAILPMTGNRSSLVWTEATEAARQLMALPN